MIARKLKKFEDAKKILPRTQFGYRNGIDTADGLLFLTHNLQTSLYRRAESRVVSLDLIPAFDLINHQALLFKLRLVGIGAFYLIFKNFF